jgi:dipeptidase E
MHFYLSSYKLGNETARLQELLKKTSGLIGYIPNSLDFTYADPIKRQENIKADISDLEQYGAKVELLDLKEYFGKSSELEQKLKKLGGVYVRGGNSFVLRQAMSLSGFDTLLLNLIPQKDFLYIAYSAGVCVLCPSLKSVAITDDPKDMPYPEITEQLWEGLGIVPFAFEPHYKSDHPESASTDKEIEYCIQNKILFQAYKDGEVLIMEKQTLT